MPEIDRYLIALGRLLNASDSTRVSMTQLADALGTDAREVKRIAPRLRDAGWIFRTADPDEPLGLNAMGWKHFTRLTGEAKAE